MPETVAQKPDTQPMTLGAPTWPSLIAAFGLSMIAWGGYTDSIWLRVVSVAILYIGITFMPLSRTFRPLRPTLISMGAALLIVALTIATALLVETVILPDAFAHSVPGVLASQAMTCAVAFVLFRWAMPVLPSYEGKHASNR